MHTVGSFSPESIEAASDRFAEAGSTAQTVVREVAKAMAFDREEYRERVDGDVVETARDAVFAEALAVTVGTREEFEAWRADHDGEVHVIGSENVDRVAWHAPGWSDEAVAATFQDEADAAVGTLRRQAFGRLYRPALTDADPDGRLEADR